MEQKHVTCAICDLSCTLSATVDNGKIVSIKGFKEQPITPNVICIKPQNALDWYYNDNRLLYPLKRKGERGSGEWERISWQQAMDEIGNKLKKAVAEYGPETFACSSSEYNIHNGSGSMRRFMNLLGSPNYFSGVSLCLGNTAAINRFTYGWFPFPDYEQTQCVVYFGHNPKSQVWAGENQRLEAAMKRGAKLIVLDPQKSKNAERAHIHLPLRAGTDAAMGLGWLNVIINKELYDKRFVKDWTVGFNRLKNRVNEYPLSKVAQITGVKADLIERAAIMYATTKPAIIPWSCVTDQQINSTSILRIQSILRAITGNLNVPGGEILMGFHPQIISETEMERHDLMPDDKKKLQLGADKYSALSYKGADQLKEFTKKVYGNEYANLLSGYGMAHPPSVFKAMREGVPYPIKAFVSSANNTLMCYSNQKGIHEALKQLDLFVVYDLFMTPTAQLADYVLPGDSWLERPSLYNFLQWASIYVTSQKVTDPPGECKGAYYFWRELALRMGHGESFPWKTIEEVYDYRIKDTGLSWNEFSANFPFYIHPPAGSLKILPQSLKALSKVKQMPKVYKLLLGLLKHQRSAREKLQSKGFGRIARLFTDGISVPGINYKKNGFATPSGKVELYSSVLEKLGYDPLPYFKDPLEAQAHLSEEYPLMFFVGEREDEYFHSAGRHVAELRKRNPEPLAFINTQTAAKYGIESGEWIWVETPNGRIEMKAKLKDSMHEDLVRVPHGWWLPEETKGEPGLSAAFKHSDVVLLSDDEIYMDTEQGLIDLRGGRCCKVYPAGEKSGKVPAAG